MTKTSKTILFFGSGPVAAKSLELLLNDFEIEAVVTKPQPLHHKEIFPVLKIAEEHGLRVITTQDQDELSSVIAEQSIQSQVGIVIDYGILISQAVIDRLPLGILNSHFSLLPRWRGADPISFAILNGDQETGVSLMLIVKELDEGPLLDQQSLPLSVKATTPSLTNQLIELSHQLLVKNLPPYLASELQPQPQSNDAVSYSRKLTKADGFIDWHKPAVEIERQIRAFIEWPKSRTSLADRQVIITRGHIIAGEDEPGKIWQEVKQFGFYTTRDIFVIDSLIPAGKQEMSAAAFLAGYKLT